MKILHVDSSILGDYSTSKKITAKIIENFKSKNNETEISYLDLSINPLPHFDGTMLNADYIKKEDVELNKKILNTFFESDIIVIGAPMYNFSIPSQLKSWIDRLLISGVTFKYTENGPIGLVNNKKLIIVSTKGGLYPDNIPNYQNDYLKAVFNFIGITDIKIINAEGLNLGENYKNESLDKAFKEIENI